MQTELKEVSPTQREITIEVEPEAVRDAYAAVSQRYAKGASVPGFRKGYAPLEVVRLRYKEEIKNDVLQQLLPSRVADAIQKYELNPLSEPHLHIDDVENIAVNGSQPINLHVHVEIMPEIAAPEYKGIEVVRRRRNVTDTEVDDLISSRLKEHSALIPVEDRASELGDTVIADLEGTIDGESGEPITAENLEIVLGDEVIEAAFTENLAGVRPDDEKEFTVKYSDDFSSSALAGKTIHYKAKIKSVGKSELPELNDEWAVSLDEGYESLADLKSKLRKDLETYADADADARVRNETVAKLIEQNEFEVPKTLIENQARNLLNNFAMDLQQRGVDLQQVNTDFVQTAYEQMKSQAARDVRGAILLDKIAEAENISVTPEEVDEEVAKIAVQYRTAPGEIKAALEQQGSHNSIHNNLRTRKSIEAMVAKAKITDGDWIDPVAAQSVGSEEKPKKAAKSKAKPKADVEATSEPKTAKEPKKRAAKPKGDS